MVSTFIELSEVAFDALFPLIPNHLNPHATWGDSDSHGCLFETYGAELDFVRQQNPLAIWTYIDGDDGSLSVVSGFHYVNRIGYLVSSTLLPEGVEVEVRLESLSEDEAGEVEASTESGESN